MWWKEEGRIVQLHIAPGDLLLLETDLQMTQIGSQEMATFEDGIYSIIFC